MSRERNSITPNYEDVGQLIPPNYKASSNKLISNEMFRNSVNSKNPFKNPKWHPLLIHHPDPVTSTLRMQRIDQKKLFTPDVEDVYHIENEVNYYR